MSDDVTFARVIDAPRETVFDALTGRDGQEAFYREPGWIVESECDLRVGGVWTVTFGPSRDELYRHDHVFRVIDRPNRLFVDTTESRPDGSRVEFEIEFMFEERDGNTLMRKPSHGYVWSKNALLSDGERLTGAYALGPEAGEWHQQATLAIRVRVPLDVLADTIQPFPTFSEIYLTGVKALRREIAAAASRPSLTPEAA